MSQQEIRVFLSYAHQDKSIVEEIYNHLNNAGFSPWMDEKNINLGENWVLATSDAIKSADIFIPIISANYLSSKSTKRELDLASQIADTLDDRKVFIIPVRLDQSMPPNDLAIYRWLDIKDENSFTLLTNALNRIKPYHLPPPEVPLELVKACVSGECVLYTGAGIGASVGYPVWAVFIRDLLDWSLSNGFIEGKLAQSLEAAYDNRQLDIVSESIVSAMEESGQGRELVEYLRSIYVDPKHRLTPFHRTLGNISFSAALTANFDVLLENIFKKQKPRTYTPTDAENLLSALAKGEFFILKLYGNVDKPNSILLSRAQFAEAVQRNRSFVRFMENLFVSRTLLFLGASLVGIETYLEGIQFTSKAKRHYALVEVKNDAFEAQAIALERRYGIKVIPFTTNGDYKEVDSFVKTLKKEIDKEINRFKKTDKFQPVSSSVDSTWLKTVKLENIGAFELLEIELDQSWNIFLGDNGVGKSSILKSIALGIAGEDVAMYADRLITYDKPQATITIETNTGDIFITELKRTTSGAEVVTRPGNFLGTKGWLTLGFPPLRSVGWERVKGAKIENGIERPAPDDVIPLISGELDPRMNKLKQWIFNLDYRRALAKEEENGPDSGYENLINEFFDIANFLTKDLNFTFERVNPDRGQIIVRTDDGAVPLEMVSQGTASLIWWVGILLQRMFEVTGKTSNVNQERALVMVDELDAHMHPEWQLNIVSLLAEKFPNTQFLATTHSPLITGSLDEGSVHTLKRDPNDRSTVIYERIKESYKGWRVDQILTSTSFGMLGTRDTETQKMISRYSELVTQDNLSKSDQDELARIVKILDLRIPVPKERKEARIAYKLIEKAVNEEIKALPEDQKQQVINELQSQTLESITGVRKPE